MKITELVVKLDDIKKQYGNVDVMLDDLYTPASQSIDNVHVEPKNGDNKEKLVAVIRD